MARQGKIARLPHYLREEVNTRILNGETAREILEWLNEHEDAKSTWWEHFEGGAGKPAKPLCVAPWWIQGLAQGP